MIRVGSYNEFEGIQKVYKISFIKDWNWKQYVSGVKILMSRIKYDIGEDSNIDLIIELGEKIADAKDYPDVDITTDSDFDFSPNVPNIVLQNYDDRIIAIDDVCVISKNKKLERIVKTMLTAYFEWDNINFFGGFSDIEEYLTETNNLTKDSKEEKPYFVLPEKQLVNQGDYVYG